MSTTTTTTITETAQPAESADTEVKKARHRNPMTKRTATARFVKVQEYKVHKTEGGKVRRFKPKTIARRRKAFASTREGAEGSYISGPRLRAEVKKAFAEFADHPELLPARLQGEKQKFRITPSALATIQMAMDLVLTRNLSAAAKLARIRTHKKDPGSFVWCQEEDIDEAHKNRLEVAYKK
jgi:hypothetical protein